MKPVFASKQFAGAVAAVGIIALTGSLRAADLSLPVTGDLLGVVTDATGSPQNGATVQVFNKYQRAVARALTDAAGRFAFAGLSADSYSVRVSLASFLPASRDQILVKAGIDSVLEIHLATLLSNIQVNYRVPAAAMSDDWKWVLRSSPATRMVTRLLPVDFPEAGPSMKPRLFSETHAMLAVSSGDGGLIDSSEIGPDLGTSFALSTNILGKNQVQLAGKLRQGTDFGPAAIALCAIYSRTDASLFATPPEVTFTLSQLGGFGAQLVSPASNPATAGLPVLRTMSLGLYQVADPLERVHIEYGATGQAVEYVQHISRVSPFARISVDLGSAGSLVASYSDGGRPDALLAHPLQSRQAELDGQSDELSQPVESLSRMPQVSERNGRLELERTRDYELGYNKKSGSTTYAVSGFRESVSNGRLNVAGDLGGLDAGDLFSDGVSTVSTYNIGSYRRVGYLASVDQRVGDSLDVALAYGRMGGFDPGGAPLQDGSWSATNRFLRQQNRNLASLSAKKTLPHLGTRISANYGWTDPRTAIPRHIFTTQDAIALPGLNILVRQPLPSFFGIAGRLELTADLRNLLADGYMPINTVDGRQLLVVEAPRAIRGGVKFTF